MNSSVPMSYYKTLIIVLGNYYESEVIRGELTRVLYHKKGRHHKKIMLKIYQWKIGRSGNVIFLQLYQRNGKIQFDCISIF